jgi:hypothetical protein
MCLKCKGFFAKSYKTRHQLKCGEDSCQALIPSIAIGTIDKYNSLDNDFKLNILNVINNDEIGTLAKTDLDYMVKLKEGLIKSWRLRSQLDAQCVDLPTFIIDLNLKKKNTLLKC